MFFAAPVQEEPVEQLPPAAVFEGAAFPDEINVIPSIEPVVHLTPSVVEGFSPTVKSPEPEPFRATEPSLAAETVADAPKEIDVHLAAPGEGEASFDPPLAAAQQNPWESELELPPPHSVVPSHSALTHPVIEAEIILRPRAPTQNTVTTKAKPSPLLTIKKDFAESFDTPPAVAAQDALIPSQPEIPAEPKTRSSWRSWWRGD
ncbi:hypothetical protein [Prosthecobacter sp.]|uniref:hypothetical protein n=1 Tax=Prosthecobacter sp. TaxID=1965333 RepID=UPI003784DD8D